MLYGFHNPMSNLFGGGVCTIFKRIRYIKLVDLIKGQMSIIKYNTISILGYLFS